MIAVAASLLPVLGLLLHVMDRVEDWLGGDPPTTARHARDRHLTLVHNDSPPPAEPSPAGPSLVGPSPAGPVPCRIDAA
ncbi:MAG: hypothetical protein JF597_07820 [Streptomyces sp.]|uniref:hypothetical protein n=1 Tax=Streptomyces sp. TaxID=1931 RepID=UPI0025FD992E|nr:hypothetical protein [Streptomyces sp.]MBW8793486.1 hypothetical protein [Streptomyces sp.]